MKKQTGEAILHSTFCLRSRVRFRLAQTSDTVAGLPLAAFFEKFSALETLKYIALAAQRGRRAQTAML
jgi:hypothetical protein